MKNAVSAIKYFITAAFIFCLPCVTYADERLNFTIHKSGAGKPVVLIVGGIQGNEPGGFSAATLLATHYKADAGQLWVVPNLNFSSIIRNSRGDMGDMNRKFAKINPSDPDYPTVRRIQEIIREPEVDAIFHLHDGSGFYRPTFESNMRNPNRWGQSVIIDMAALNDNPFGNLEERSSQAIANVNKQLLHASHLFHVKNTKTDEGNPEMEKTLTWFAVLNGKAAYGLETSKDFLLEERVYYHLLAIEAMLTQYGVKFSRDFTLTPAEVKKTLQSDLRVAFGKERYALPLENIRPRLNGLIPLPRDQYADISVSKPIIAVTRDKNDICIYYGNRLLTRLKPEWHEQDNSLDGFDVLVDGQPKRVLLGELVAVENDFVVNPIPGYRMRAIGTGRGPDESGQTILKKHFRPDFSVDTSETVFRVEIYRDKQFSGMFLVQYGKASVALQNAPLPNMPAQNSGAGR